MTLPQRISSDPTTPVQGQSVEICFDFAGLDTGSTTLLVSWTPSSLPTTQQEVTPDNPCFILTVPSTATAMLVEDLGGYSADYGTPVSAPEMRAGQ